MFSGTGENKDICHVGSALFLGNNIKLMCSNQVDTLEQVVWSEFYTDSFDWAEGKESAGFVAPTYYSYADSSDNCPYELIRIPDEEYVYGRRKRGGVVRGREDWIEVAVKNAASNNYSNLSKVLVGKAVNGKSSGLSVKFNSWKNDRWMAGE